MRMHGVVLTRYGSLWGCMDWSSPVTVHHKYAWTGHHQAWFTTRMHGLVIIRHGSPWGCMDWSSPGMLTMGMHGLVHKDALTGHHQAQFTTGIQALVITRHGSPRGCRHWSSPGTVHHEDMLDEERFSEGLCTNYWGFYYFLPVGSYSLGLITQFPRRTNCLRNLTSPQKMS